MDYSEILDFGDGPATSVDEKLAILKFEYSWAEAMEEHDRKMEIHEAVEHLKHADVCNDVASEDQRNIPGDRNMEILQPSQEDQIPQECHVEMKQESVGAESNEQITLKEKDRCIPKKEESVTSTEDMSKKQTGKLEDEEGLLSKFEELLQKLEGDMPMEEVWKQQRDFQEDCGTQMANINSMSVDGTLPEKLPTFKDGNQNLLEKLNETNEETMKVEQNSTKGLAKQSAKEEMKTQLENIGDGLDSQPNRLGKVTQEEKKQKEGRHQDANLAQKLRAQLSERHIKKKRRRVKRSDNKIQDENFKNQCKLTVEEDGQHNHGKLSRREERGCKLKEKTQISDEGYKNQYKPTVEEELRPGDLCLEKEDKGQLNNGELSRREENECKLEGKTQLEEKNTKNKECEEGKEEKKETADGLPKEGSTTKKTMDQGKWFEEKEKLITGNEEDKRMTIQTDHGYTTNENEDATNVVEKEMKQQTEGTDKHNIKEVELDAFVSAVTVNLAKVVDDYEDDDDDDDDAGFLPRRLFFFSFSQFKDEERTTY